MKEIDGETISALLDGELQPDVRQAAVSRLLDAGDDALDTFGRYRLIGDLMRDEATSVTPVANRVREALRDEPTVLAPDRSATSRWLRPVAGVAVAASVAAAAIVITPQLITDEGPALQPLAVTAELPRPAIAPQLVATNPAAPAKSITGNSSEPSTVRWQTLDADLAQRLNRLVIEHHEYAGRTGVHGPVPHIGLVSYDAR